ncbi:MAG: hypothetical protein NVV70_03520 [Cellulomonas sp.]|uniref:Uncharacterized protein n=1 Tax=Cellulomonas gelida TaxID=1712 RepID=A0A4Y3KGI5_9CELL|nr:MULTISPECIES: hypothetical protein [Cellulomonas]MCR6647238.1 hypothetical protein [Cellulomonas sp.]MCR6703253.1 hypothetical protein [Cellulomonas sp.]GEA82983.1 hypothetical protein CGE01nite_02340 [Cellulomonas gelida]GGL35644.1 hypothetical protein GCM10009774_27700 [Cellulomonas gelida]
MDLLLADPTDQQTDTVTTLSNEVIETTFLAAARALDDDLPPFWD